jgi:predicted Zn finger-like uncharacterized protein
MFTVCPKCSLKLVVTAADLRVAQGYVRCGRCSNVFNALIGLSDEQQAVLAQEAGETEGREALEAAAHDSEARQEPPAETRSDAELEFDPSQTDVSEVFIEPRLEEQGATGTFESITLRSEDEPELEDEPDAQLSAQPPGGPADHPASADAQRPEDDAAASGLVASSNASVHEFELEDLLEPASRSDPGAGASVPAQPEPQRREAQRSDAQPPASQPPASQRPEAQRPEAYRPEAQRPEAQRPETQRPETQRPEAQPAATARKTAGSSVQIRKPERPTLAPVRASPPISRRAGSKSLDSVRQAAIARPDAAPSTAARAPAVRAGRDYLLPASVAGLAVLLGAQVVHHYRSALATNGWLRPPLTAIYAALGAPLVPRWDVTAYEVHQLGAVAGVDRPGSLTVRASIKNTAAAPQPLPLLRVTVQDRFGNHVASRDVLPRAYLPKARSRSMYLASGQRVDAEVELVDPGASAVGFEIDACLADSSGRISCANDASDASAER